jgi:hypothetical protein
VIQIGLIAIHDGFEYEFPRESSICLLIGASCSPGMRAQIEGSAFPAESGVGRTTFTIMPLRDWGEALRPFRLFGVLRMDFLTAHWRASAHGESHGRSSPRWPRNAPSEDGHSHSARGSSA